MMFVWRVSSNRYGPAHAFIPDEEISLCGRVRYVRELARVDCWQCWHCLKEIEARTIGAKP